MKPIATDTYTFEKLINGGYLYIDKTAQLERLIDGSLGSQFFLARPRRFGKSLAVSTLQAIFECRRELFKGLAIDKSGYEWEQFPVIRLDMSTTAADTVEDFAVKVNGLLRENASRLGLQLETCPLPDQNFKDLVLAAAGLSQSGKVVLLVDEYDKPLLNHLGTPKVEEFRSVLKQFYSVIKATESRQRFAFMTGVSKFSKVSIFSDLNNLTDLTMRSETATLFGYTHDEVRVNFAEHLEALAQANGLAAEEAYSKAIEMYDGYRFEENAQRVVNPVSFGKCLVERKFDSYWYETGTPTFLVDMLRRRPMNLSKLELSKNDLGTYEPANPSIVPLLFQTGYLTMESAVQFGGKTRIKLRFPNTEVRDAFNTSLMPVYAGEDGIILGNAQDRCVDALFAGDLEEFFDAMKVFFAGIPYDLTGGGGEQIWQTILYTVFRFIGVCVETEVETNRGRIDAVVKSPRRIYVIEVKLDKTACEAIRQIRENGYAVKYAGGERLVTLVGIGFSSERREISEWKAEEYE